jgi:hypothetical protein
MSAVHNSGERCRVLRSDGHRVFVKLTTGTEAGRKMWCAVSELLFIG